MRAVDPPTADPVGQTIVSPAAERTVRVLVVHNYYAWRGGEDAVVDDEVRLLRDHGHTVELYSRDAQELASAAALRVAADAIWSRRSYADVDRLIERMQPAIVHVHNSVPLVSPSVIWAAARHRVPVVQTLHNFRLACLAGTFLRDSAVCEGCLGRTPWRGVVHACYRGSPVQSAGLATTLLAHRLLGTYRRHVAHFIALSAFARSKLMAAGIPPERIAVKPNAVDVPAPSETDDAERAGGLFVGRLSDEKGLDTLAQACANDVFASITVVGDGPLAHTIAGVPAFRPRGPLAPAMVHALMRRARFLVLPSRSYEGFPRVLAEAFGSGLPIIASRIGSLAELVEDGITGLLVPPNDARALAAAMRWAQAHPTAMAAMGANARRVYLQRYTPASNHAALLAIYARAASFVHARARTRASGATSRP